MAATGSVGTYKSPRCSLLQDAGPKEPAAKTLTVEKPEKRRAASLWQRWKDLPWKLEIASWTTSLLILIAIVIVLRRFQGRPPPDLPLNITVNAMIGMLAMIGEVLLTCSVASVLGHSNWLRAVRKKTMQDLWLTDVASRRPRKSLKLLMRGKGGIVASMVAITSVLVIATNAFVQQILRYDTHYSAHGDALMPVAKVINGTSTTINNDGFNMPSVPDVDSSMLSALYTGVSSPPHTDFVATAHCDSGNCTWPPYQSLAICNACVNLTSQLNMTKVHVDANEDYGGPYDTTFYTLPNGFGLTGTHPPVWSKFLHKRLSLLNVTTSGILLPRNYPTIKPKFDSVAFVQNGSMFGTVFAIGPSPGTARTRPRADMTGSNSSLPLAFECALQLCIQNMTATVVNGALSEKHVSTWTNDTLDFGRAPDNQTETIVLQSPDYPGSFVIRRSALEGTGLSLVNVLSGNVTTNYSDNVTIFVPMSNVTGKIFQAMNASATGFPDIMDNLANSLSLALRKLPSQPDFVRGTSYSSTSHLIVRWAWLALPVFVLLSSLMFLIRAIKEKRRRNLVPLGNNIMAPLFHGLDQRPNRKARDRQNRMESAAGQYLMEFHSSENR